MGSIFKTKSIVLNMKYMAIIRPVRMEQAPPTPVENYFFSWKVNVKLLP